MRIAGVLLLLACAATAQHAEPPAGSPRTESELREALAGTDPMRAAWAAHRLRAPDDQRLQKELREAVRHWRGPRPQQRHARLHVLDALIGRNASVPGQYVVPLLDDP